MRPNRKICLVFRASKNDNAGMLPDEGHTCGCSCWSYRDKLCCLTCSVHLVFGLCFCAHVFHSPLCVWSILLLWSSCHSQRECIVLPCSLHLVQLCSPCRIRGCVACLSVFIATQLRQSVISLCYVCGLDVGGTFVSHLYHTDFMVVLVLCSVAHAPLVVSSY